MRTPLSLLIYAPIIVVLWLAVNKKPPKFCSTVKKPSSQDHTCWWGMVDSICIFIPVGNDNYGTAGDKTKVGQNDFQ
jgi:hypothetical protein